MTLNKSLIALALGLAITGSAQAGTASSDFQATVEVISDCSIQADNLNFGQVGLLTSNVDASSTVQIYCTAAVPFSLRMIPNDATAYPSFHMDNGSGVAISYGLYLDAARTTPWGYSNFNYLTGTSAGGAESIPVYGRIPPQTSVLADTYAQTVTAQITF